MFDCNILTEKAVVTDCMPIIIQMTYIIKGSWSYCSDIISAFFLNPKTEKFLEKCLENSPSKGYKGWDHLVRVGLIFGTLVKIVILSKYLVQNILQSLKL